MSLTVGLQELKDQVTAYGAAAFLITTAGDGRPHVVSVAVSWDGDALVVAPGNKSATNAAARPLVSLLWPPLEPGGYSLIADATATEVHAPGDGGNRMVLVPSGAVRHRSAVDPGTGDACGSDCVPVLPKARQL